MGDTIGPSPSREAEGAISQCTHFQHEPPDLVYQPWRTRVIDEVLEISLPAIVVSPLITVLAMVIGCSILDDTGESDYQPLFIAARMGALGGPIAALVCVLISAALSHEETLEDPLEPIEVIRLSRKVESARTCWGIVTPYMIGLAGGPIGSGILHAANLAHSISPISAVRATAIGGIFATPIYYLSTYLVMMALKFCLADDILEGVETESAMSSRASHV